jgi:hypothetical protein
MRYFKAEEPDSANSQQICRIRRCTGRFVAPMLSRELRNYREPGPEAGAGESDA